MTIRRNLAVLGLLCASLVATGAGSQQASAAGVRIPIAPYRECPAVGQSGSCGVLVVVNPDRSVSVYTDSGVPPYDGIEDTLVGVRNDSDSSISAITVNGPGTDLAGLDGDGLCVYTVPGCPFGPTGYEGPNTRIVTIAGLPDSAEIDFPQGLAAGGATYFSLEGVLSTATLSAREGPLGGSLTPPAVNLPGGAWSATWFCTSGSVSLGLETASGQPLDGSYAFSTSGLPVTGNGTTYVQGFNAGAPGDYVAVMSCGSTATRVAFTVSGAQYVALGDSFSSGEGASAFISGTGNPDDAIDLGHSDNRCHRAVNGYVVRTSAAAGLGVDFAACSGATIHDLYQANTRNPGEIPQLAHLAAAGKSRADIRLVTISIGVNDIGFEGVLTDCVDVPPAAAVFGPHGKFGCNGRNSTLMDQALSFLSEGMPAGSHDLPGITSSGRHPTVTGPVPSIAEVLAEIHSRAPNAKILVLGYPQLWGDSFRPDVYGRGKGTCTVGTGFGLLQLKVDWPDSRWMNSVSNNLDSVLADGVSVAAGLGANIRLVDTKPAFNPSKSDDYRLCGSKPPRLRALDLSGKKPLMVSFHPKDSGQQAMATIISAAAR